MLNIPVPNTGPIILCAVGIGNKTTAEELLVYHKRVMHGLAEAGIWVVGYATDGATVERACARLFADRHCSKTIYKVPHSKPGYPPRTFEFYHYRGFPWSILQDPPHALKTARNNAFAGSKLMLIGNYPVTYHIVKKIAEHPDSPVYRRDVEKLDRQDDMAATRLFSAGTLKHVVTHHPEERGLIVYLFVFGEIVDAYLSRTMKPADRLRIAFRTQTFLDLWEGWQEKVGYKLRYHCLSPEAREIFRVLINAIVTSIVTYRSYRPTGDTSERGVPPLLTWLLSTAVNEHIFGVARLIIANFTAADLIYMQPKINILLSGDFQSNQDPRLRAGGYFHHWWKFAGFAHKDASTLPWDEEMILIAAEGFQEGHDLCNATGFGADDVMGASGPNTGLPNFGTLFGTGRTHSSTNGYDSGEESDDSVWEKDQVSGRKSVEEVAEQVLEEFQLREDLGHPPTDRKLHELSHKNLALKIANSMQLYVENKMLPGFSMF